jgi:hypothetical protein
MIITRVITKILCLLCLLPTLLMASDTVVINDTSVYLPLHYEAAQTGEFGKAVNEHSEMIIKGINNDSEPRIIILRFDDYRSNNYRSRLNVERVVTPGPFAVHLPLFGLKTGEKRKFNWQKWRRFIVFTDSDKQKVSVDHITISRNASFSEASFGFDLGSADSPVMKGMTQITPKFAGLKGKYLRARHYVSGDALSSDGIEGIESLDVNVPNGRWDVTLWFAMRGQWENLPRQRNQHIRLQGETVWQRNLTSLEWLNNDYLAGQYQEAYLDGSVWDLFGNKPQHRTTATVTVTDGQLHLTFAGLTTHDNYLSGIFISPTDEQGRDAVRLLDAMKQRFEQKWQVVNYPQVQEARQQVEINQVYFDQKWQPDVANVLKEDAAVVTPDSYAVLDFSITSPQVLDNVMLRLALTDETGNKLELPVEIRQGVWRYQRPLGASTLLSLSADELQTVYPGKLLRLSQELSRRINLVVPVPADFRSSIIKGKLTLQKAQEVLATEQFDIKVLDIALPAMRQSVGIYHEKAVHWGWFPRLSKNADETLACDYRYLDKLGLTALSPPLSTPDAATGAMTSVQLAQTATTYVNDLKQYQQVFDGAAIDYTTIKRFENYYRHRPLVKQRQLAALAQTLDANGLRLPQFAIADEVHELDAEQLSKFSAMIAELQNAMPGASFVGQLNKPANMQLVPMLDTLLINYGFGVSTDAITALQRQGKSVWLYNMTRMRLAAGFYLWRSKAQGYLQWHGRMPTGEPFSPVDGREADFQMIYPTRQTCLETPDINSALLAIAQGITDRRWLNWLIKHSRVNKEAKKLLTRLRQQIPTEWEDVEALSDQQVHLWRTAITDLAQKLTTQAEPKYVKN